MTTTLNTELKDHGVALTFPDGRNAGQIAYDLETRRYHFESPDRPTFGPDRNCLEAAQFDALAWAAEKAMIAAEQSI